MIRGMFFTKIYSTLFENTQQFLNTGQTYAIHIVCGLSNSSSGNGKAGNSEFLSDAQLCLSMQYVEMRWCWKISSLY